MQMHWLLLCKNAIVKKANVAVLFVRLCKDKMQVINQNLSCLHKERKLVMRKSKSPGKKKTKKAQPNTPDSSSSDKLDDNMSVHVKNPSEVQQACWETIKKSFAPTKMELSAP